ncbi:MAG: glycosyltransferase family 9 protein [Cetobacterium sp.]
MRGALIKLIGNKKRKEIKNENIRKVLIQGGRLGDIITKTPMLEELSKLNSNLKIDITVIKGCESLVQNVPYINLIKEDTNTFKKNKMLRMYKELKFALENRGKYDLYFDFKNSSRFFHILTLKLLAPKYLIGMERLEKFGIKRDELTLFDAYVKNEDIHMADIGMKFLEPLNLNSSSNLYKLYLGDKDESFENYFNSEKINIVLNHKASTEKRSFNIVELEEILRKLSCLGDDLEIHLSSIPSEYSSLETLIHKIDLKNVTMLKKTDEVLDLAALVKYSDIVVSVDTGMIHIASVYNKPIVGVYPLDQNSYKLFAPRSENYSIVRGKKLGYTIEGFSIDEVVEKTGKYIKEKRKNDKK